MRSVRHQKQHRTSEVAVAGPPHWPCPSRAHILMDATTMPSFFSASSPPPKHEHARAVGACIAGTAGASGFGLSGSIFSLEPVPRTGVASTMAAAQRECVWVTVAGATVKRPPGWGKPEGCSGVIVNTRAKEEWERIHVVGCTLLGVSKRKRSREPGLAASARSSSVAPLSLPERW